MTKQKQIDDITFKATAALLRCLLGSIAGGAFIALGTYASRVCPYPILSPLLFAVGILLVMVFDVELVTRRIPILGFGSMALVVLAVNLLTAFLIGLSFESDFAPELNVGLFARSIVAGLMIGLVSINNFKETNYKVVVALIIMYIFVMTGMPHCVVYAFLRVDFPTIFVVSVGNMIGGLILNKFFLWHDSLKILSKTGRNNSRK